MIRIRAWMGTGPNDWWATSTIKESREFSRYGIRAKAYRWLLKQIYDNVIVDDLSEGLEK